jgi:hypothetical protein
MVGSKLPLDLHSIALNTSEKEKLKENFKLYRRTLLDAKDLPDFLLSLVGLFRVDIVESIFSTESDVEVTTTKFLRKEIRSTRISSGDKVSVQRYVDACRTRLAQLVDLKNKIFKKKVETLKKLSHSSNSSFELPNELPVDKCTDIGVWTFGNTSTLSLFSKTVFDLDELQNLTFASAPLVCFEGVVQSALARSDWFLPLSPCVCVCSYPCLLFLPDLVWRWTRISRSSQCVCRQACPWC